MGIKIRKGDTVAIIAGDDKGTMDNPRLGRVLSVDEEKHRVIVEKVNMVKRHTKARQQGEESQIVSFPAPIAVSKVMLIDPKTDAPTRVRRRVDTDGTVERVSVRSGQPIPRSRA